MADTTELIGFAIEKRPVDFADSLDQLLRQKAAEKLETHREYLAQSIYGEPETADMDDDADLDAGVDDDLAFADDSDLDIDDDELDIDDSDLDLDDDELDIDDSDLDLDDDDLDIDDSDLDLEDINEPTE